MIWRLALAGTLAFSTFFVGFGQYFARAEQAHISVRPMKVEVDVPANRTVRVVLTVRNYHATRIEPLNLSVVDLTQYIDGTLRIVTDEMRERLDPSQLRASSREWVQLPADRIEVPPETSVEIPVLLRVPPDPRGVYASGVMITTDTPTIPPGTGTTQEAVFAVSFGFLVPLITGIEGRPVRQNVSIRDVAMEHDDGKDEVGNQVGEPTTHVYMEILNDGQTYSSLLGEVVVERRVGSNWRPVTRVELSRRNILPGLTLRLPADLGRRLPSGEYRLLGTLYVDGRRLPRFEKVIDFSGDPAVTSVAFDTTLELLPPNVGLTGVPGATRTNTVEVSNPGEQPLNVLIEVVTPEPLRGTAMGVVLGEDLSAAPWTTIQPNEFTLGAGQRRNVRVISRLPREGLDHANYYADIILSGHYEDGQSAGETKSTLHVRQQQIGLAPAGILDRLSVSIAEEDSAYIVQSRFVNTGNVDMEPTLRAELIGSGSRRFSVWQLTGVPGRLLPLGVRDYSASVNINDIEAGEYVLRVTAEHDGVRLIDRQLPVYVTIVEGEDDAEDLRELILVEEQAEPVADAD